MKKTSLKRVLSYILPCVIFTAMIAWFLIALTNVSSSTEENELSALQTTVENSITMCYAIEGVDPEDIEYLCDHYGLVFDRNKYIVHYEKFASNIRPTVKILERRAESEEI